MTRRAAWLLTLAVAAAPACDGATTEAAETNADASGPDAVDAEVGVDAADAQEEPECIVHSDCVPAGGEKPEFTCRVHECVNGACEEVPVSIEKRCTWLSPYDRPGRCSLKGECVGCANALGEWERRTCVENPSCCWATENISPYPPPPGTQMACFGTCVEGMCIEPEGGCQWF